MKNLNWGAVSAIALFISLSHQVEAQSLVIKNVTLIDGTGRMPVAAQTVVVEDGLVSDIVPAAYFEDRGIESIDGTGKYLIPGLMDMHIHLRGYVVLGPKSVKEKTLDRDAGVRALHSYLYAGVTSIYDSGNDPDYIFSLRKQERDGELTAPRIYASGAIATYPGSHGSSITATLIDDWPEAKGALDKHFARKPDVLKLTYEERGWGAREMIPMLPKELLEKTVEYANDHGIRTTVHVSNEIRAREAIFAGVDNLSHPIIQGPVTDRFTQLMAAKRIPVTTTLTIGERYSRLAETPQYLDKPLYKASIPKAEREKLKGKTRAEYQARPWTWWMKIMTPIAQENLRKLHDAGALLALGTDQSLGADVHREMELLVNAGISPLDVIRIATLNGARFLGKEDEMGSVEVGKLADMVLLNADPILSIANAEDINTVIKGGRIVDLSKLMLPVNGK